MGTRRAGPETSGRGALPGPLGPWQNDASTERPSSMGEPSMLGNWVEVLRTCNLPQDRRMDPVSKWLIITRSCVFSITALSALLGGLLAAFDGAFSLSRWLLVLAGLVLAHAANNMINDLFDTLEGVDTDDYPRAHYAPHPILDRLVSRNTLIAAIVACVLVDFVIAVILTRRCGWPVMVFAVAGFLTSLFYVAPPLKLKHRGFGELALLIIWGPLMISGTYYVMAGSVAGPDLARLPPLRPGRRPGAHGEAHGQARERQGEGCEDIARGARAKGCDTGDATCRMGVLPLDRCPGLLRRAAMADTARGDHAAPGEPPHRCTRTAPAHDDTRGLFSCRGRRARAFQEAIRPLPAPGSLSPVASLVRGMVYLVDQGCGRIFFTGSPGRRCGKENPGALERALELEGGGGPGPPAVLRADLPWPTGRQPPSAKRLCPAGDAGRSRDSCAEPTLAIKEGHRPWGTPP
jgi:hypothetical protein